MKKLFFVFAATALCAACSQENEVANIQTKSENSIQFSAYSKTNVLTRGTVQSVADFNGKGIGVFAFYQPEEKGNFNSYKYAVPDFMYNQEVKPNITTAATYYEASDLTEISGVTYVTASLNSGALHDPVTDPTTQNIQKNVGDLKTPAVYGDTWTYNPVKYWPNNDGDKLSFFAYAPYSDKTWEDMGFKTDVNAKKLTVSFPIYQDVVDQVDYIYADPVLNKTKQGVDAQGNVYHNGVNNIKFDFAHITSQVNLYVGVEQNTATQSNTIWDDPNTVIEVKSIEFKDCSTAISYSYDISAGSVGTLSTTMSEEKQNIVLTSDNFIAEAAKIDHVNYATAGYKKLNKDNSVLFLAPENLKDVVVTYTVTTTDVKLADGKSVVTNTIPYTFTTPLTLTSGNAYNLCFLIGMNSVKIVSKLVDWNFVGSSYIDVPANN